MMMIHIIAVSVLIAAFARAYFLPPAVALQPPSARSAQAAIGATIFRRHARVRRQIPCLSTRRRHYYASCLRGTAAKRVSF